MQLKGRLIIIGGGEDKNSSSDHSDYKMHGVLQRILDESKHSTKSRIEIVTTASLDEEIGNDYIVAFKKLKANDVKVLRTASRDDANTAEVIQRVEKADIVFFTGGDQLRLTTILGGTAFFDTLMSRLKKDPGFIYAGTSAVAAVASENMISNGSSRDAILKGEIKITSGFGLVENVVFDTHFLTRGRIGRLFQLIVTNPQILGVGLEEDSGLLIKNNKMESIGPGMAIIVDGRDIRNHNLLDIRQGAPISIDSLRLWVMSLTDVFDIDQRKLNIITPEDHKI